MPHDIVSMIYSMKSGTSLKILSPLRHKHKFNLTTCSGVKKSLVVGTILVLVLFLGHNLDKNGLIDFCQSSTYPTV